MRLSRSLSMVSIIRVLEAILTKIYEPFSTLFTAFPHDNRGTKNWLVIRLLLAGLVSLSALLGHAEGPRGRSLRDPAIPALPARSGTHRRPPVYPSRRRASRDLGLRRAASGHRPDGRLPWPLCHSPGRTIDRGLW